MDPHQTEHAHNLIINVFGFWNKSWFLYKEKKILEYKLWLDCESENSDFWIYYVMMYINRVFSPSTSDVWRVCDVLYRRFTGNREVRQTAESCKRGNIWRYG